MLKTSIKSLALGGRIAVAAALLSSTAMAQDATVVETPEGNVAVVPEAATTTQSPIGTVSDNHVPILEQIENDQAVAETLVAQGFTDIHIKRQGALMTVNAQRDGQPTELVYSVANGSLVSVDGVELRAEPEPSTRETTTTAPSEAATDGATPADPDADVADDGAGGTGDDTGTDAGTDDDSDTDAGGTDGGSDASDGAADGAGDAGGDGADGSDSSGDGSDGDGGSDSDGSAGEGGDAGGTNG
jgi:hypothetical protein